MKATFTPDELYLLIDVVTLHQMKIENRFPRLKNAIAIDYHKKRLNKIKNLNHKLRQVEQELKMIHLKGLHKDVVGRIIDPDL